MQQHDQLPLDRCSHCNIAKPLLDRIFGPVDSTNYAENASSAWSLYRCNTCGGLVLARSPKDVRYAITDIWPSPQSVADEIPDRAREFLNQSIASIHAPAGAVMLAASAVDAMLKAKNYKTGNLNSRINKAAEDHVITQEMAAWAHDIRLDANDQRHADEDAGLPSTADAEKVIEFAQALAQFLFVLPARVARGRRGQTPAD